MPLIGWPAVPPTLLLVGPTLPSPGEYTTCALNPPSMSGVVYWMVFARRAFRLVCTPLSVVMMPMLLAIDVLPGMKLSLPPRPRIGVVISPICTVPSVSLRRPTN